MRAVPGRERHQAQGSAFAQADGECWGHRSFRVTAGVLNHALAARPSGIGLG